MIRQLNLLNDCQSLLNQFPFEFEGRTKSKRSNLKENGWWGRFPRSVSAPSMLVSSEVSIPAVEATCINAFRRPSVNNDVPTTMDALDPAFPAAGHRASAISVAIE